MKKLVLIGLLFVGFNCFAQGTTQKEFNYASKGYKDDLDMGKDIISGYVVERVGNSRTIVNESGIGVQRISNLYKLVRSSTGTIAAFILEEKRVDNGVVSYLCLPNSLSDAQMWKQAQDAYLKKSQDYNCVKAGQAFAYNWNILQMLSITLSDL